MWEEVGAPIGLAEEEAGPNSPSCQIVQAAAEQVQLQMSALVRSHRCGVGHLAAPRLLKQLGDSVGTIDLLHAEDLLGPRVYPGRRGNIRKGLGYPRFKTLCLHLFPLKTCEHSSGGSQNTPFFAEPVWHLAASDRPLFASALSGTRGMTRPGRVAPAGQLQECFQGRSGGCGSTVPPEPVSHRTQTLDHANVGSSSLSQ